MPAVSAFPGGSALVASFRKKSSCFNSSRFGSSSYCACRCSIKNKVALRAWVEFKDGRNGSRAAWLHTDSNGSVSVTAVEGSKDLDMGFDVHGSENGGDDEKGKEDKRLRLNRRQRGSSNASAVVANPDLLTIPGVGPRNLRKLVDKGIARVAELKQLYKDKVIYCYL